MRFIGPVISFRRNTHEGKPEREDDSYPWPAYFESFAWDLTFDLIGYRSSKNLYTGETKRVLVIFWFIKIKV